MASTPLSSGEHHVVPTSTYVFTLLALVVLMLLTVFAAQVNLPAIGPFSGTIVNQTVALAIACVKAALVVFIFMGVKYGTTLTKFWALVGFVWFTLLFMIMIDYPMRGYEPTPGWDGKEDSALPRLPGTSKPGPVEDLNELNVHNRQ